MTLSLTLWLQFGRCWCGLSNICFMGNIQSLTTKEKHGLSSPRGHKQLELICRLESWEGACFVFLLMVKYLQNEFKLAGASHNECCFNCKANKSDVPYNDFRPAAAWRKTIVRHKDKTPTSHPLKKIPGVNGHSFHYDTLHNLEEGVPAHAVGNAMFDLVCRTGGFPGTQEEALQTLYKKIAQQYVEQGIESSNRIKRLTFSSFCNAKSKFDNFPVLSGFKAKHIRWLVNCMAPILQEFVVEEDPYTKHRLLVMENLEGMYDCMDRCHLHMDKATAKQFKQFGDMALLHYAKCSKISISASKLAWSTTPKFHWVAHMVEQAAFLNPKYVSTYSGDHGGVPSILSPCMFEWGCTSQSPRKSCLEVQAGPPPQISTWVWRNSFWQWRVGQCLVNLGLAKRLTLALGIWLCSCLFHQGLAKGLFGCLLLLPIVVLQKGLLTTRSWKNNFLITCLSHQGLAKGLFDYLLVSGPCKNWCLITCLSDLKVLQKGFSITCLSHQGLAKGLFDLYYSMQAKKKKAAWDMWEIWEFLAKSRRYTGVNRNFKIWKHTKYYFLKLSEINLIEIDLCFNDIMEIILLKWPFISIKLLKFALLK